MRWRVFGVLFWIALSPVFGQGNADDPTRWALDAQIGMGQPVIGRNDLTGPGYFVGPTRSASGMITKLRAELYMPNTHFSLKGGYEHERLDILSGDAETELSEVMLGGRWYPAPWRWYAQPYIGLDAYVNTGSLHDNCQMSSSEGYKRMIDIRNPRLSAAPVIGCDLYLFSHIALQLEYGFRLGIDSRMTATSSFPRMGDTPYVTRSNLYRHTFTVGVKVTFPFGFTEEDGNTLVKGLVDLLLGNTN